VRDTATVTDVNPYGMQAHMYDKCRPENVAFLQRVRQVLDEFGAVSIGEVGADDALAFMAEYTAGGDKLHMAYSFNLLTEDHSARHIRTQVEDFKRRVKDGWASWSVGNHDVPRVATRWGAGNGVANSRHVRQAGAGDAAVAERHAVPVPGRRAGLHRGGRAV
jgi:alpha-glucosidase